LNNESASPQKPQSVSPTKGRWPAILDEVASRWHGEETSQHIPRTLVPWLLHKLHARLERGSSGGDGVAQALPACASPPDQVVPALDRMEFETLVAMMEARALDRSSLAAVHSTFAEARAELAGRQVQALERSLTARDRQLSVATHELRTPISSILLNLQMLERAARTRGALESEAIGRFLAVPSRQLRRLTRMVDLLLDSAQVETDRLLLDPQPLDLCELVHDSAARLADLAAAAGCELDLSGCEPVEGRWDRLRLEQVVNNLLTNAIKYGGSRVEVATRPGDEVAIAIRDHGRGIAAEDQQRIFEPFERLHSAGSEEGAGLGLYIVREIVRAHGGRIEVESRVGQGATFTVILPHSSTGARQGGKQA
jgi:signal transduction histidine kinase